MPPKRGAAKAKGKAKAKAKAKPKAAPKIHARPAARVRMGLRRPAAAIASPGRRTSPTGTPLEEWEKGEAVLARDMPLDKVLGAQQIAIEEGTYYQVKCRLAGKVLGAVVCGAMTMVKVAPTGTDSESILKTHTASPDKAFRVHFCPVSCNHEVVADDIVHATKVRWTLQPEQEEGWVNNMVKVPAEDVVDELAVLRERERISREGAREAEPEREKKGRSPDAKDKKEEKSSKKKKKKKEKKKKKSGSETSEETVAKDGSSCKMASRKKPKALFAGTGLDGKEKVRQRVAKKAKKLLKKSKKEDSSSSGSGDSGSDLEEIVDDPDESIFDQATKAKTISEAYPGVLGAQAIAQMRSQLLGTIGEEDRPGKIPPVAMQYYKQVLQSKASPPQQRELATLACIIDNLLMGKAAQAVDYGVQRLKSQELSLNGAHWNVSQRLELVPPAQQAIAGLSEIRDAQKDVHFDSKVRSLASQPDGRPYQGNKGQGKKGDRRDDPGKGDQRRKGGKNGGGKGDGGKKKDAPEAKNWRPS